VPVAGKSLEDVGRPVARLVVRGDDEIDARVQVVLDVGLDDVRLVPDGKRWKVAWAAWEGVR